MESEITIWSILKPQKSIKAYGKVADDGCKSVPFGAKLGANGKITCAAVSFDNKDVSSADSAPYII